jgi:hypothetical protein
MGKGKSRKKQAEVFDHMVAAMKGAISTFPDKRTGKNKKYSLEQAALGAFSVFFTQCPSFLAYQEAMQEAEGKSNAQTLFQMEEIPSDNHIRDLLDPVSVELVVPVFDEGLRLLREADILEGYRVLNGTVLVAIDGTWYFSSPTLHCDNCSTMHHKNGSVTYYHCMINPVLVAPGQDKAIALKPEFIVPQDGHDKQDCESVASRRWLRKHGPHYSEIGITLLGDDLYSKQPICEEALAQGFHFLFVCKPDTHKTLYEWIELLEEGKDRHTVVQRYWNGRFREIHTYRYANGIPLRDTDDAMEVNWCEITISKESGEILYRNSFISDHRVTDKNVELLALCGRTRWKTENENNNTLKTKGYNLEHNYGHGKKNLSYLLATLIILSFLFHTMLHFMDARYRAIRERLPRRVDFFNDIRALTRYKCFDSWEDMMRFMMRGLKLSLDSS